MTDRRYDLMVQLPNKEWIVFDSFSTYQFGREMRLFLKTVYPNLRSKLMEVVDED